MDKSHVTNWKGLADKLRGVTGLLPNEPLRRFFLEDRPSPLELAIALGHVTTSIKAMSALVPSLEPFHGMDQSQKTSKSLKSKEDHLQWELGFYLGSLKLRLADGSRIINHQYAQQARHHTLPALLTAQEHLNGFTDEVATAWFNNHEAGHIMSYQTHFQHSGPQ